MQRLCLTLLLVCAGASPSWAEDPVATAPGFAEAVAALPAPAADAAWTFSGVMRMNGKRAGHAKISMTVETDAAGQAQWLATDALMIKVNARPMVRVTSATCDRSLRPQKGLLRAVNMGIAPLSWVRTPKGVRVTETTQNGQVTEEKVRTFEVSEEVLTTIAATVHFCRSVLDTPGVYETHLLQVREAMGGKAVTVPVRLEVEGIQTLDGGHEVHAVKGTKADETLSLLFDKKTRAPIAIRLQDSKRTLEILKGDEWTLPATTPEAAALRTALGLGSGNVEILDDVTHWPEWHRRALAGRSEEDKQKEAPDLETFRTRVLESWTQKLPKNQPGMIQSVLKGIAPQITYEEIKPGVVKATFPESFRSIEMLLLRDAGIWYTGALGNTR